MQINYWFNNWFSTNGTAGWTANIPGVKPSGNVCIEFGKNSLNLFISSLAFDLLDSVASLTNCLLNGIAKNLFTEYKSPSPVNPDPAPVAPTITPGPMLDAARKAPDLAINVLTSGKTSGNCLNAPKKFDNSLISVCLYVFNSSSVASYFKLCGFDKPSSSNNLLKSPPSNFIYFLDI